MIKTIKRKFKFLIKYPIHPQWLIKDTKLELIRLIEQIGENKVVLDVGCYSKWAKQHCPPTSDYIGFDYYETAKVWYGSQPDVYGDALSMPIKKNSIDVVLLIDVLEHIKDTERLLEQIYNCLKVDGIVILSFPFLYPIHDMPRDYVRFTYYGFEEIAFRKGFEIVFSEAIGSPILTSTFLFNVALTKTVINWIAEKNPAALFGVFLPFIVLINNLITKLISLFEKKDDFMTLSYHVKLKKL